MLLSIRDNKTFSELQEKFNLCFPHLKMEFYEKRHNWKHTSPESERIKEDRFIADIRKIHTNGIIAIKSWDKTGDIEQQFKEEYGLNIQLFRLENDRWVQSVKSDKLTLTAQSKINDTGKPK